MPPRAGAARCARRGFARGLSSLRSKNVLPIDRSKLSPIHRPHKAALRPLFFRERRCFASAMAEASSTSPRHCEPPGRANAPDDRLREAIQRRDRDRTALSQVLLARRSPVRVPEMMVHARSKLPETLGKLAKLRWAAIFTDPKWIEHGCAKAGDVAIVARHEGQAVGHRRRCQQAIDDRDRPDGAHASPVVGDRIVDAEYATAECGLHLPQPSFERRGFVRVRSACPGEVESGSPGRTVVRRQGHAPTL